MKLREELGVDNKVSMTGIISAPLQFSHEVYGDNFYTTILKTCRTSGVYDEVPILVSDRLIEINDYTGCKVVIDGQIRTFNKHNDNSSKLLIHVFVKEIDFIDLDFSDINEVILNGFVCKKPIYRTTPSGKEISDMILAVNRPYGKSDYIPCICWGRNARFCNDVDVGDHVELYGRFQSRTYEKKLEDTVEERVAYEISTISMRLV